MLMLAPPRQRLPVCSDGKNAHLSFHPTTSGTTDSEKYAAGTSTCAAFLVVVEVDVDRILEVAAELFRLLLRQSIPSND